MDAPSRLTPAGRALSIVSERLDTVVLSYLVGTLGRYQRASVGCRHSVEEFFRTLMLLANWMGMIK